MSNLINDVLSLVSDMESFVPVGDGLTDILSNSVDNELDEAELSYINAAASMPSFEVFWKRYLNNE